MRRAATCHPERVNFGHGLCKSCWNEQWRKNNPEKAARARELQRAAYRRWELRHPTARSEYYRRNKARIDAKSAAWRKQHPERTKDYYRKSVFGLDAETYWDCMARQNNSCAICGKVFGQGKDQSPHVDHDHATGQFRGLLCNPCNMMLGFARDSQETLAAGIRYLEQPPAHSIANGQPADHPSPRPGICRP